MSALMVIAGSTIVVAVLVDALTTTMAPSVGGGPLTARLGRWLWSAARRPASRPDSRRLVAAGPGILLVTAVVWILLLLVGWLLVFSATPEAVVGSVDREPADVVARLYFTGYTLFTLGIGDYVAGGDPWRIASTLATVNGLGLVTLAVTYLLPVVTAVTDRRRQAAAISRYGTDVVTFLAAVFDGHDLRYLDQFLPSFAQGIDQTAQRHLTYPVLHYFHSRERDTAYAPSIAVLHEALVVIESVVPADVRPHPAGMLATRRAIHDLARLTAGSFTRGGPASVPPTVDLDRLRSAGLPVDDVAGALLHDGDVADDRRRLAAYVEDGRWSWADAVLGAGTP